MAVTRSQKKARSKANYRRLKNSPCRRKGPAVCRSKKECKYVSGKKRNFCRKRKSKKLSLKRVRFRN